MDTPDPNGIAPHARGYHSEDEGGADPGCDHVVVTASCAELAGELGDAVIRDLFATGLTLYSVATRVGPGPAADRLRAATADLDGTINRIRRTVLALRVKPARGADGAASLLQAIDEFTPALGFAPVTRFVGPVGDLAAELVIDLDAVLREALTNVAQHAHAGAVDVELAVHGGGGVLQITDDGIGCDGAPENGGLTDMRRRAKWHGGDLTLAPGTASGTRLTWAVPLS